MSTFTTDFRPAAVARPTALRAADGVIAGYIHTLAREAAAPAAQETGEPVLDRLVKHVHECGASRSSGLAARRRHALRRVPAPA